MPIGVGYEKTKKKKRKSKPKYTLSEKMLFGNRKGKVRHLWE